MSDEDAPVISFAEELKRRKGVVLDEDQVARGVPQPPARVRVDPEHNFVVKLAMEIISRIRESADEHPVGVIAALQIVGSTLSGEYVLMYGREKAVKIVAHATAISREYKPEYKDGKELRDGEAGQVDTDPKDEPER